MTNPILEPAPCDDCCNAVTCRDYQMACRDFFYFVHDGKVLNKDRTPRRVAYLRIFRENG